MISGAPLKNLSVECFSTMYVLSLFDVFTVYLLNFEASNKIIAKMANNSFLLQRRVFKSDILQWENYNADLKAPLKGPLHVRFEAVLWNIKMLEFELW